MENLKEVLDANFGGNCVSDVKAVVLAVLSPVIPENSFEFSSLLEGDIQEACVVLGGEGDEALAVDLNGILEDLKSEEKNFGYYYDDSRNCALCVLFKEEAASYKCVGWSLLPGLTSSEFLRGLLDFIRLYSFCN